MCQWIVNDVEDNRNLTGQWLASLPPLCAIGVLASKRTPADRGRRMQAAHPCVPLLSSGTPGVEDRFSRTLVYCWCRGTDLRTTWLTKSASSNWISGLLDQLLFVPARGARKWIRSLARCCVRLQTYSIVVWHDLGQRDASLQDRRRQHHQRNSAARTDMEL